MKDRLLIVLAWLLVAFTTLATLGGSHDMTLALIAVYIFWAGPFYSKEAQWTT